MTRCLAVVVFAIAVCLTSAAFAEEGPAKDVPELQALSRYVGTWDVAITSENSPLAKGQATANWILDGRFVQQNGSVMSADGETVFKITTLMTYDQKEKAYRMWSFLSNGTASESSGQWDARNRTMTSIHRDGGATTTTTAKFREDGTEEWTIVTVNANNEVAGKISGTNTRRKQ